MSVYIEAFSIYIFCIFLYPFQNTISYDLRFLLLAFILTCFSISVKNKNFQLAILITAFALCICYPVLAYFLPAIMYPACFHKNYLASTISIFVAIYCIHEPFKNLLFLLLTFILSFYLAVRCCERQHLKTSILQMRDDKVEQEMRLKKKNEQLLSSQNEEIFVATSKERNRIAREIHDNVGHTLSRSILQVGALLAICKDEMLKKHLDQLKSSLDDAMNNIRNSVHDLHDESIDLASALQTMVDNFTFCPISFQCDISRNVNKEVKYCLIAITKEALNNIIKHSNATNVTLTVKEHPAFYQLLIYDNGTKPFSVTDNSGIGLSNMKERVDALNGIIQITAENGVKIFLTIPKS